MLSLGRNRIFQRLILIAAIAVCVVCGAVALRSSHAATASIQNEPESGVTIKGALPKPDSSASGGKSLSFQVAPRYGVLGTDAQYRTADEAAGIKFFEFDLDWSQWEPSQDTFSSSYERQVVSMLQTYAAASDTIAVGVGLQSPPAWVSQLPNGQLKDQNGNVAQLAPNYEFSPEVQAAMKTYVTHAVKALGPLVDQYRIGYGQYGEIQYPNPVQNIPNTWYIGSVPATLPAGVSPNPMPGWIPGTPSWQGKSVTVAMATNWYDWYSGSLQITQIAEANAMRSAGFIGQIAILAAGQGADPFTYQYRLNKLLAGEESDPYGTMNTGTTYQYIIPYIKAHVAGPLIVDATSAGDGSGTSGQLNCQPSDSAMSTAPGSTDSMGWATTRYIHALTVQSGLPFEIESAGGASTIDVVFAQNKMCNSLFLQWLNDPMLAGVWGNVSRQQYADSIKQNPL